MLDILDKLEIEWELRENRVEPLEVFARYANENKIGLSEFARHYILNTSALREYFI